MGRKVKASGLSREECMVQCIGDIIQELIQAHHQGKDVNLNKCKTRLSSKYGLDSSPRLVDIIAAVPLEFKNILVPKLRAKPVRTASGLKQLGHSVDKVEFIVMGGTFMALNQEYKDYFIRNLHDALSGNSSDSVEEAVRYSEKSPTKCIGITIETRPDYCLKKHLSEMLSYGCTRLEIGVQSVYEDVARDTNRGHTVRAVCESFQQAKDAGFKVVSHMMPDLPNVDFERDVEQFIEFFENPAFRADGLKIYPTLVIRGTGLYELWKTGRYKSYPPDVLVDLVARILALVPPWTRVYRVQRDIPMPLVSSGSLMPLFQSYPIENPKERRGGPYPLLYRVGTRNYYRKLGYELDGPYMSKEILL
ncbi:hypothetical protein TCAL_08406 [Tigriopus californicus]|uniref:Elp3/MiaA/NifB-like radical SAM core domain-containing protein n=1 Tax=Tigriopus californicus TaxID=6832 RepID=A0A553N965_TIGCA|nr:hypothetical protein TCAL_08406 [Tigriopus californicus]